MIKKCKGCCGMSEEGCLTKRWKGEQVSLPRSSQPKEEQGFARLNNLKFKSQIITWLETIVLAPCLNKPDFYLCMQLHCP